ncbi:hypothetical protein F8M41_011106 [Gigaspora margarita]|uniref:Uncharacterized protein n=1 Tax=Gigaspora margarita TaxID=4874 RepID=A0A8H4AU27_GIGMA|nr:hypothetical protein F8M41_011106 [Gigaspora margarita]
MEKELNISPTQWITPIMPQFLWNTPSLYRISRSAELLLLDKHSLYRIFRPAELQLWDKPKYNLTQFIELVVYIRKTDIQHSDIDFDFATVSFMNLFYHSFAVDDAPLWLTFAFDVPCEYQIYFEIRVLVEVIIK